LIGVVAIIILVICCIINLFGATAPDKAAQDFSPQIECDKSVTYEATQALKDF
jgi:hypothetical protein